MTATTVLDRPTASPRPSATTGSDCTYPTRSIFLPLEPCTEPVSAILERTAHLLAEDHGDVTCGHCGAHRSIGRRAGDGGAFRCLAGCDA